MSRAKRVAAASGRPLRVLFADEARFGRMNRPQACWAPAGIRPEVAAQLIREYIYLYGAVCPTDGRCAFLILPASDAECFQIFLNVLAKKFRRSHILLVVDGAGNHGSNDLVIPRNLTLASPPAYSPERFAKRSLKTMPPNQSMKSATCSWKPRSTSKAIRRSSNP